MNSFIFSQWRKLLAVSFTAMTTLTTQAVMFDGGVDSENLGKGDWIYYVSAATNRMGGNVSTVIDIPTFMAFEKSQGINYIIVKAGTGSTNFNGGGSSPQFNSNLVYQAHAAGLKIFAYTRSYGADVPGEIAMATACFNLGADGFVLDAEAEWESNRPWIGNNGPALATQLCSGIKSLWPTKFLAHAPMPIISFHSSFPYKEFGYYCDTVMPQIYHYSFDMTPSAAIDWTDTEWNNFHNSLTGVWTNAIKPIAPVGQVYGPLSPPEASVIPDKDVTEFCDYLLADPFSASPGGYKGVNFWRADLHGSVQWANIKAATSGNMPGIVNHIVIDNPLATVVGTWTTATIATNKFGVNYRYIGQGSGANYVQFRPTIVTPGDYKVYEWHTAGANRSVGAPHVISYNGGSTTVNVNQQLNEAKWNLLGTFNFATGTAGYVRITDGFADAGKVAIADAIKFVFAGTITPPPSAPTGLTATAIRANRIDLSWVDTSANEANFIVARSTTSGGPYTDIVTLAANTTSYSNIGLAANTTYYYVVRATNVGGSSANSGQASATTFETDLLIDNKSAVVVGAWSTGTSSTDKYGTDYRFLTQGSGANSVKFTPYIAVAGAFQVFEWHPQGANRTTNAPHVITHSGGTTTVHANQEINGGQWNSVGVFNFSAGTSGNIKITDDFPDGTQVVMADAIKLVPVTVATFTSVAAHDGYVLESGETTSVGGTLSATGNGTSGLRIGDDLSDKQYKSVVSFDTSSLPDGATILSVTLKLKRGALTGANPFTTHGSCYADIKGGTGFGGANALAIGDFQAAADATQVATMSNPAANDTWSTGTVVAAGLSVVNKTGHTQFRVYFSIGDNDDLGNDYLGFYSGENATVGNRPVLEIVYQ